MAGTESQPQFTRISIKEAMKKVGELKGKMVLDTGNKTLQGIGQTRAQARAGRATLMLSGNVVADVPLSFELTLL